MRFVFHTYLTGETGSPQSLRHHSFAKLRSRMVMLCNKVCHLYGADILLVDRSLSVERRPLVVSPKSCISLIAILKYLSSVALKRKSLPTYPGLRYSLGAYII